MKRYDWAMIFFLAASATVLADVLTDIGTAFQKVGTSAKEGARQIGADIKKGVAQLDTEIKKTVFKVGEAINKGVAESAEPLDAWILPNPNKRFDEVTYLGAHNAHANVEDGFTLYAQQLWSLEKQLEKGVRHFLIDIWPYEGKLLLCHGGCDVKARVQTGGKPFKTFRSSLETIKAFLDKNPNEIISLELETYATARDMRHDIESVPGLSSYLLTPQKYDPHAHGDRWPRLRDLQKDNTRLIIFDVPKESSSGDLAFYGYDTNAYMRRNMYGTLDMNRACMVRGSKKEGQKLNQLNFFGTITSPLAIYNTPSSLKRLWNSCRAKGIFEGNRPNFLAIDFVDRGNAMRWVNELNKR